MESNSEETILSVPHLSGDSSNLPITNTETSDKDDEDDWGFNEPRCNWKPLGRDEEDCGEGVVCPPCG